MDVIRSERTGVPGTRAFRVLGWGSKSKDLWLGPAHLKQLQGQDTTSPISATIAYDRSRAAGS
jgi:hypothetical protein